MIPYDDAGYSLHLAVLQFAPVQRRRAENKWEALRYELNFSEGAISSCAKWDAEIQEQTTSASIRDRDVRRDRNGHSTGIRLTLMKPLQVAVGTTARLSLASLRTFLICSFRKVARALVSEDAKALQSLVENEGIVVYTFGNGPGTRRRTTASNPIETAWGDNWNGRCCRRALLVDSGGSSIDDWLRNHFFAEHCALFHHRPFIWHIWDGRKTGRVPRAPKLSQAGRSRR